MFKFLNNHRVTILLVAYFGLVVYGAIQANQEQLNISKAAADEIVLQTGTYPTKR